MKRHDIEQTTTTVAKKKKKNSGITRENHELQGVRGFEAVVALVVASCWKTKTKRGRKKKKVERTLKTTLHRGGLCHTPLLLSHLQQPPASWLPLRSFARVCVRVFLVSITTVMHTHCNHAAVSRSAGKHVLAKKKSARECSLLLLLLALLAALHPSCHRRGERKKKTQRAIKQSTTHRRKQTSAQKGVKQGSDKHKGKKKRKWTWACNQSYRS
jgi:hypothetical protein